MVNVLSITVKVLGSWGPKTLCTSLDVWQHAVIETGLPRLSSATQVVKFSKAASVQISSEFYLLGMAMIEVFFFLLDNTSCATLILLLGQGWIVHLPDDLSKKFIHHWFTFCWCFHERTAPFLSQSSAFWRHNLSFWFQIHFVSY